MTTTAMPIVPPVSREPRAHGPHQASSSSIPPLLPHNFPSLPAVSDRQPASQPASLSITPAHAGVTTLFLCGFFLLLGDGGQTTTTLEASRGRVQQACRPEMSREMPLASRGGSMPFSLRQKHLSSLRSPLSHSGSRVTSLDFLSLPFLRIGCCGW